MQGWSFNGDSKLTAYDLQPEIRRAYVRWIALGYCETITSCSSRTLRLEQITDT